MKTLLITTLLAAMTAGAAELKYPAFRMTEPELLAVLKENGLNDKVTAVQELTHIGGKASVAPIAACLTDDTQKALFHAARFALQNNPDPAAETALKGALATVKDAGRLAALKNSLKLRANPTPDGYVGAPEKLIAFPPKSPLQNGDLSVVPALVDQAANGAGFDAQLARRQLVGFPNAAITGTLRDIATGTDVKKARVAVGVLGERREHAAFPFLCELARNTKETSVRGEVCKAFATLCNGKDLPQLLTLLKCLPQEDRLIGSIIRIGANELVPEPGVITVVKAQFGYFGPDSAKGQVVDVMDMVTELIKGGSRSITSGCRLAGRGGFAFDPAPGKVKQLRLTYRVGNGPLLSTETRETEEIELVGNMLPDCLAKQLVDAASSATGDYRAALVKIIDTLDKRGRVAGADTVLFRPIFNGKDLTGWSQQDGYFSVKDGVIIGASTPEHLCKPNHHLIYTAETLTDFELRAEFKLSRRANSGIQLRCLPQFIGDNGYQADMDGGGNYPGFLYHPRQHLVGERGADVTLDAQGKKTVKRFADGKELAKLYKIEQWNDIRVKVEGRTINVWINGVRTTSINDAREEFFPAKGHIGLQLHAGPPMTVEFRNLRIR